MSPFVGNVAHTDCDGTRYYHGFRRHSTIFTPLNYVLFTDSSGVDMYGKIHSVFEEIGGVPSCEMQIFSFVPDDEMRTDGSTFDECYAVTGDTIIVQLNKISPREVNVIWVPPSVSDADLVSYVDSHLAVDEYPDSSAESEDDDDRDFIVTGEQWAFYQYAINAEAPENVFYAPPPQFNDAWMSKKPTDGIDGDLGRYVAHNFWGPVVEKRWPGESPAAKFLEATTGDTYCDAFRDAFMRMVEHDVCVREAHELCLNFVLNYPPRSGKRHRDEPPNIA